MIKPITPDEVKSVMPDEIIQVFNELIQKYWNGTRAHFKQSEAVELATKLMELPRETLFERHYLDIEDLYRQAGWDVEYDKPGYNETYPSTFTFSKLL